MISLLVPDERGTVLTVSENGYGKRTPVGSSRPRGAPARA
jgi:hypothetical protein